MQNPPGSCVQGFEGQKNAGFFVAKIDGAKSPGIPKEICGHKAAL
jgi:hypothetical protein